MAAVSPGSSPSIRAAAAARRPSLAAVEAAARLEPTGPAPAPNGGDPPVLAARVGPIPFPDWQQKFGWKAVGAREDEVSGRTVKTVYYRNPDGARLGYSIVAGEPLLERPPGHEVTREGNTYHVANAGAAHGRHLDPAGPHLHLRRLLDRPRGEPRRTGGVPEHLTT